MTTSLTLSQLRHRHPRFYYRSVQGEISPQGLEVTAEFTTEPDLRFQARVTIHGVTQSLWESFSEEWRKHWLLHLGMAEIPTYWKATGSPEIIIEAGYLSQPQLQWWHDLLIKGMGEYFYVNDIDFTAQDFVTLRSASAAAEPAAGAEPPARPEGAAAVTQAERREPRYLLPIGGGKESSLSLCLFEEHGIEYGTFVLNPTPATEHLINQANPIQTLTASRVIDPRLLELNQMGYLNGHVPFSAYLAFLSTFVASLFDFSSVSISNERSSNEGNVTFHGQVINHQYSKSFEFEQAFQAYIAQHLTGDLAGNEARHSAGDLTSGYFSLLRPLYELQISRAFTTCPSFEQYAPLFRSCNRGQKTNSWCGECPKCLFTFVSLFPWIGEAPTVQIFGQNLFEKDTLWSLATELLGVSTKKPFECVGTHEENVAAFYLASQWYHRHRLPLPALLHRVETEILAYQSNLHERTTAVLTAWNTNHRVPEGLAQLVKSAAQKQ